jgi:hypothetical protein
MFLTKIAVSKYSTPLQKSIVPILHIYSNLLIKDTPQFSIIWMKVQFIEFLSHYLTNVKIYHLENKQVTPQ